MDTWFQRARTLAEEAAKRSQDLSKEAAKLSQGIVSETTKRSREFAVEATKKADQIKIEALKRAEQIKTIAEGISPQIPSISLSSDSTVSSSDLEKFGITDDLRDFVKGITLNTFQDFPMEDEPETAEVPSVGNVRQDLTEWQARHAMLVLSTVKEISQFRYELCPRHMKERKFWRIYFLLVSSHVSPYEKRYMDDLKLKPEEQDKDSRVQESPATGTASKSVITEPSLQSKSSTTEQDLDVFLLGDLGSSDEDPDVGDGGFDDDFDKIVNSSGEDDEDLTKKAVTKAA